MKTLSLSLVMIVAAMTLWGSITFNYEFTNPVFKKTERGIQISLEGAQGFGNPTEPDIPWFGYKLLLPVGNEACEVVVKRSDQISFKLDDIIFPVQTQYPNSHDVIEAWDEPSDEVYLSDAVFPQKAEKGLRTEFLNGHPIAFGAFSPFDYKPNENKLTFYRKVEVEISFKSTSRAQAATTLIKKDAFIMQRLHTSVDNSADIPNYNLFRETGCEYLMIIDANKLGQWQPLGNYYNNRGISVALQPLDQIYASTPGRDDQEKIRNFIINFYATNPLRYVLLGGDTNVIPHRGFYVSMSTEYTDADIPADMYYSCLDGDWNTNNNSLWGEDQEADLAPELALGRICYNNDAEIANQINKIILYQASPVLDQIKSASFLGENMSEEPTWGGDYMDEMIGGSNTSGYSTVGVPTSWNISTLYDRTSTWSSSEALTLLSNGANLVNHLGHSNTTYNMKISNYQVTSSNISNDGVAQNYSIYFTQGCHAGSFDNRGTQPNSYGEDCITEKFSALPTSAVGMISHSRYGWYSRGSTNGASQHLHREYIDAIFGEEINALGYTLVDAKIDNIPFTTNNPLMHWISYETNLFGCPVTSIWSDTPASITVNFPSAWLVGQTQYTIQTNAPHAQLKIKQGTETYYEGFADESGLINVDLQESLFPGNYVLYLNATNFYPSTHNIFVTASNMPYIACENVTTSDADGILQTGEVINLSMTIKNLGMVNLDSGGTISLSSDCPNIQILQGEYSFNSVSTTDSLFAADAFQISIVGSFADRTEATLTFNAAFGSYETESYHRLDLSAPILNILSYTIHSGGPYVMPGDLASINLNIQNTGRGTAFSSMMLISSGNNGVTINSPDLVIPTLEAGENLEFEDVFSLSISDNVELGTNISLNYMLWAESGSVVEGSFIVRIGMISFDFETGMQDWSTSQLNPNYINQWHLSDEKNYTPAGSYSLKFGGNSGTQYANKAYGALTSPEIDLAPNSTLRFRHWMNAQNHVTLPTQAWDGGNVQMSLNDGAWFLIEPVGGYSHHIFNNAVSPFPMGIPVYSGSFDWSGAEFDLAAYSGPARIRFVFGSDVSIGGGGWFIDDVRFESQQSSAIADPSTLAILTMAQNFPNPFNPTTCISFYLPGAQTAKLSIYNLKGQLVKKLCDGILPAGQTVLNWDGTDSRGNKVSSGVYSYRLESGKECITRKMLLIK